MKTKKFDNYNEMEYLCIKLPLKKEIIGDEVHDIIDAQPLQIEKEIILAILKNDVQIKGKEVIFIRKSLGLSCTKFGELLGYDGSTILKWEKSPSIRLSLANELAVRTIANKYFELDLDLDILDSRIKVQKKIMIDLTAKDDEASDQKKLLEEMYHELEITHKMMARVLKKSSQKFTSSLPKMTSKSRRTAR